MSALAVNLLAFGRLLRALGLDVTASQSREALTAVAAVGVARRSDVYHALRATLVSRSADLAIFDAAFTAFWRDHGAAASRRPAGDAYDRAVEQAEIAGPRGRHAGHVGSRGSGRRVGRRATDRDDPHVERSRDPARPGLRRRHVGRARPDARRPVDARLEPRRASHAPLDARGRRPRRPAPCLARERAQRRVAASADPYPDHASAAAGAGGRRERVDGAVLAHAAALRLRAAAHTRSRGGVPVLDPAHARDP